MVLFKDLDCRRFMLVFTFFMLLIWFEQIDLIDCLVFCCWICILRHRKPWKTQTFSPTPLFFFFFFLFFPIFFLFFFSPYYTFGCLLTFVFCLSSCMFRPRPVSPACFPYPTTPLPHSAPGRPYPTLGANKTLAGKLCHLLGLHAPLGFCPLGTPKPPTLHLQITVMVCDFTNSLTGLGPRLDTLSPTPRPPSHVMYFLNFALLPDHE